jgi:hypothetical protein
MTRELFENIHSHFGYVILVGMAVSVWAQKARWNLISWTVLASIAFWLLHTIGVGLYNTPHAGAGILLAGGAVFLLTRMERRDTPFWAWMYVVGLWTMEGMAKAVGFSVDPYPPPACKGCIEAIQYGYVERLWVGTEVGWIAFSVFLMWGIGLSRWYRSAQTSNQVGAPIGLGFLALHTFWMIFKGIVTSGDSDSRLAHGQVSLHIAVLVVSSVFLGVTLLRGTWALRAFAVALTLLGVLHVVSGGLYRTWW